MTDFHCFTNPTHTQSLTHVLNVALLLVGYILVKVLAAVIRLLLPEVLSNLVL